MNSRTTACLAFFAFIGTLGHAYDSLAAERPKLGYRLAMRTSAHFDKPRDAEANLKTFEKLGCEASKRQHNGHIDVIYQCPQWKSITLNDAQ